MKTIITTKYGSPDVLKVTESVKPIPKEDEILINNQARPIVGMNSPNRQYQLNTVESDLKKSINNYSIIFGIVILKIVCFLFEESVKYEGFTASVTNFLLVSSPVFVLKS